MKVRGHTLTGDRQIPSWLNDPTLSPNQLRGILQDHITTVMRHYAGSVYGWDVLNEAYEENGLLKSGIWLDKPGIGLTGTGYMEQALRWAHAADPAARLFYNDNDDSGLGMTPKTDAIYRMAQDFLARGVPLNGIGLEMHVTLGSISLPGLAANIKRLTALGLEVQITEMDVRLPVDSYGVASASDLSAQAQIYHDVIATCLEFSGCTTLQTWEFNDSHSWISAAFPGFGAALPLDANYRTKPAWDAMINALAAPPSAAAVSTWYRISSDQFRNAASRLTGSIAPEELVLFAAPSGPGNLVGATSIGGSYPTQLGGMQVTFDGIPAPILAAQNGFVLLVAPRELAARNTTTVQFLYLGNTSNTLQLPVAPSAPGLFTMADSGTGAAMILDRNLAPVSAASPARSGDLVFLRLTGVGSVSPSNATGQGQPYVILTPQQSITVTVGGVSIFPTWIWGDPSGVPGMVLAALIVPSGLPPGNAAVTLESGTANGQPGVTIPLR